MKSPTAELTQTSPHPLQASGCSHSTTSSFRPPSARLQGLCWYLGPSLTWLC